MSSPMLPRDRADYSAIVDRPPLKRPGDARVIFWSIVNYEVWDIGRPMPRQVIPGADRRAAAARRAALELARIRHAGRRPALLRAVRKSSASARRSPPMHAPARISRARRRGGEALGWEFMGHAYDQMPIHKVEDQRGMINRSMGIIEKYTGKRPVGWLGPGLHADARHARAPGRGRREVHRRLGLRRRADRKIRTAKGPLPTLPYTVEINDITMMIVQHHPQRTHCSAAPRDQFDRTRGSKAPSARQDHGARDPSLYQRATAPDQISRGDLRLRERLRRRAAPPERRGDLRLVPRHRGREARHGGG